MLRITPMFLLLLYIIGDVFLGNKTHSVRGFTKGRQIRRIVRMFLPIIIRVKCLLLYLRTRSRVSNILRLGPKSGFGHTEVQDQMTSQPEIPQVLVVHFCYFNVYDTNHKYVRYHSHIFIV